MPAQGASSHQARAASSVTAAVWFRLAHRVQIRSNLLLVDTVGFVQDLSHGLVSCFHATLQETLLCDVIVLVIDGASPNLEAQRRTVLQTLTRLQLQPSLLEHRIEVYNKCDLLDHERRAQVVRNRPCEREVGTGAGRLTEEGRMTGSRRVDRDSGHHSRRSQRGHRGEPGHWSSRSMGGNEKENCGEDWRSRSAEGGQGSDVPDSHPTILFTSALTGEGCDELLSAIGQEATRRTGRARHVIDLPISAPEQVRVRAQAAFHFASYSASSPAAVPTGQPRWPRSNQ